MKVSFKDCIIEGMEEYFKRFWNYIVYAGIVYILYRFIHSPVKTIQTLNLNNGIELILIYFYYGLIFIIGTYFIYYLVIQIGVHYIVQSKEEKLDKDEIRALKTKKMRKILKTNQAMYIKNMIILVIYMSMIILSRNLVLKLLEFYNISNNFMVELFINLVYAFILLTIFYVYIIGAYQSIKENTFKKSKQFMKEAHEESIKFLAVIVLTVFIIMRLSGYFREMANYLTLLIPKIEILFYNLGIDFNLSLTTITIHKYLIEFPIMIFAYSILILYIIIHVFYTLDVKRIYFKDDYWLTDHHE